MFITVIFSDLSNPEIEKSILVNPECPLGVFLEYIRTNVGLQKYDEFDLCPETGVLKNLNETSMFTNASTLMEDRETFFVVHIQRDADCVSYHLLLPRNHEIYNELSSKIKENACVCDSGLNLSGVTNLSGSKGSRSSTSKRGSKSLSSTGTKKSSSGSVKSGSSNNRRLSSAGSKEKRSGSNVKM
ncbi:uncharacterized protein CXorf65 homolog [Ctenocephalides felis]|uniref:uncharacterized protein CXorf65 homolog n=2 Tax=Ctenocephalides felis TaxID=7515 RepID=UPI000E6E51DD|nr:uncharacterized protein CXorf65 homolog [Ctenocephalides felis]